MIGRDKIRQIVTDALSGKLRMTTALHQIHRVINDEKCWKEERRDDTEVTPPEEKPEPELYDEGQDSRSILDIALDFLPDVE